jgi:hypothetical protein
MVAAMGAYGERGEDRDDCAFDQRIGQAERGEPSDGLEIDNV